MNIKRYFLPLILLASAFVGWPPGALDAQADSGFVVVVNQANQTTSISRSDLSRIFLRQVRRWPDGTAAQPVDLQTSSPTRDAFSRAVHGRSARAIAGFWRQQIFSGRAVPPAEQPSEGAVLRFVAQNRGGVGYVSARPSSGRIRVLTVDR